MCSPITPFSRKHEGLLRLFSRRGRRALRAFPSLQHILRVESQEETDVPHGVVADPIGQCIHPEGVAILRQELALQRRQHLQRVVNGIRAEKWREGSFPYV